MQLATRFWAGFSGPSDGILTGLLQRDLNIYHQRSKADVAGWQGVSTMPVYSVIRARENDVIMVFLILVILVVEFSMCLFFTNIKFKKPEKGKKCWESILQTD